MAQLLPKSIDVLTPEQRHRCMSHIRSSNTRPERMVRRFLFACGMRFRKNVKALPGTPDIVLRKYRTVIFVNGCFWHGHEACKYYHLPKSNTAFWRDKISRNRQRDARNVAQLQHLGWHVIVIWECELKPAVRVGTLDALYLKLNRYFLQQCEVVSAYHHAETTSCLLLAAEPTAGYERSNED